VLESDIYDYLQENMPSGFQFINPFLNNVAIPTDGTDCAVMVILSNEAVDRGNYVKQGYDEITDKITYKYNVNVVYTVQIVFYGVNSMYNASLFRDNLQLNLDDNTDSENSENLNLKSIKSIINKTEFVDGKFIKNCSFDIELFSVETIVKTYDPLKGWVLVTPPCIFGAN